MAEKTTAEMKPTLGLTGLTMNAMALIAPGAFLWLTFLPQAHRGNDRAGHVARHFRGPALVSGHGGFLC